MPRRSESVGPETFNCINIEDDTNTSIEDPDHEGNKTKYEAQKRIKIAPKRVIHVYRGDDHILWYNAKQDIWCKKSNYDINREQIDQRYAQLIHEMLCVDCSISTRVVQFQTILNDFESLDNADIDKELFGDDVTGTDTATTNTLQTNAASDKLEETDQQELTAINSIVSDEASLIVSSSTGLNISEKADQQELTSMNSIVSDKVDQQEHEQELKVNKKRKVDTIQDSSAAGYNQLINLALDAYKKCVKRKTGSDKKSNVIVFFVLENMTSDDGCWTEITDTTIISHLSKLKDGTAKNNSVTYSFNGEHYSATTGVDTLMTSAENGSFATQTNMSTGIKRDIRSLIVERFNLKREDSYNILFGCSPISISTTKMDDILRKFNFIAPQQSLFSYELAELAQLFFDINQMNYKYINKKDKQCKCELYIKPGWLYNFLMIGKSRKYSHMRLVIHGGDKATYDGIRDDFIGPNLAFDSKNNAKGPGFYCGLSYDVVTQYNSEKEGTGIMALVWTNKNIDKNHGSYENYNLFSPDGSKNAMVVHEACLVLILGKIVPL